MMLQLQFNNRVALSSCNRPSSPIPLAMARIRAPTGGICPRYLVTTYIGDVDYSAHCDLIEEKRSLIFLIARTLWALFAAWILFG